MNNDKTLDKCTFEGCEDKHYAYWGEGKHYCKKHSSMERDRLIALSKSRLRKRRE
jgi:hypothetical protein